jgi:hypothetical protein
MSGRKTLYERFNLELGFTIWLPRGFKGEVQSGFHNFAHVTPLVGRTELYFI